MKTTLQKTILIATLALFGLSNVANAQTSWIQYSGNPIMDTTFDPNFYGPSVLYDGTTYRMWFTRKSGTTEKIGYATSTDGLSWTLIDSLAVVPSTDPNRFDNKKAGQPTVIQDGSTFKMWYWGEGNNGNAIGYATSSDGQNWTKVDGGASDKSVFDKTIDGASALGLNTPNVIKDGSTYKMWYSRLSIGSSINFRIAYATSTDGITWTNTAGTGTNGAVIDLAAGKFDANAAYYPCVIKNGTQYEMWYAGSDNIALSKGFRIGYATSSDGIAWTKISGNGVKNCVLDSAICPSVILSGSTYKMWYSGNAGVNYATSGSATGLSSIVSIAITNIYPNPSTGKFVVQSGDNHIQSIMIYNVLGENIYHSTALKQEFAIDLSSHGKGIYFVKIQKDEKIYNQKIVIE